MGNYTSIAKEKIQSLMSQENFEGKGFQCDRYSILRFTGNKVCKVDRLGNVCWVSEE